MQFVFERETYRIAFRHPAPTDLAYHAEHQVELRRSGGQVGPYQLFCVECEMEPGTLGSVRLMPKPEPRSIACLISVWTRGRTVSRI